MALVLDDIPITYKPEIIEWLRKLNQKDKESKIF